MYVLNCEIKFYILLKWCKKYDFIIARLYNKQLLMINLLSMLMSVDTNITEVEPQVPCVRLSGRINLNFSTTYAVDCGA